MQKFLSHLIIIAVSILCPVLLIGGNYLIEKNKRSTDSHLNNENLKRLNYSNHYTTTDSLYYGRIK